MDTDDLTRDAYGVLIGKSREVSEFLTPIIGSESRLYPDENTYLEAMHEYVSSIAGEAEIFLDDWNLHDSDPKEFQAKLRGLAEAIRNVLQTPIGARGPKGE